jgi:hypothetical protein
MVKRCKTLKKLNLELSQDHERFLTFMCFAASGLVGYFLTHFFGLLH